MIHRVSTSACWFSAVLYLVLGASGCRPASVEPADEAVGSVEPKANPLSSGRLKEDDSRAFEKEFAELRGSIAKSSFPWGKKMELVRKFIQNAKLAEVTLGVKIQAVKLAEEELENLKRSEEGAAEGEYRKLEEKVRPHLEGPSPDIPKASALAEEFPTQLYRGSPVLNKLEALKAKIQLYGSAELEASRRIETARTMEDPVKIIALLEGFDPHYDGTPFAREVQALIKENYKKYVERRESREAGFKDARWDDVDLQGFRLIWPENATWVDWKDGILELGPNGAEYHQQDHQDLSRAAGTCVQIGDDGWVDVELHFEVQVEGAEGVFLGARGHLGAGDLYNFYWKGLNELGDTGEEWHQYLVRIEGDSMVITDSTAKKLARKDRLTPRPGPFGIRVTGPKAAIKLRTMRVWVKSQEGEAPPAGDTEEEKKIKKKGGETRKGKKGKKQ